MPANRSVSAFTGTRNRRSWDVCAARASACSRVSRQPIPSTFAAAHAVGASGGPSTRNMRRNSGSLMATVSRVGRMVCSVKQPPTFARDRERAKRLALDRRTGCQIEVADQRRRPGAVGGVDQHRGQPAINDRLALRRYGAQRNFREPPRERPAPRRSLARFDGSIRRFAGSVSRWVPRRRAAPRAPIPRGKGVPGSTRACA
jgi:hypothetical protein